MTHRMTHLMTSLALAGLAVFLGILQSLLPASTATAATGIGHGPGYLSGDGWWLGTYRLDDGTQGFCLNAGKLSPTGFDYDYADGDALGWFTAEQSAKLAYISRSWAGTDDRFTAAAGQIATWLVAGLGDHTPEEMAARAGSDAAGVLARAHAMADEAGRLGSTGVRAEVVVELAETGPGRLRVELTADRLGGATQLPPGAHTARLTLDGAVFADGSSEADVPSGTDAPITPTGAEQSVSVSSVAAFGSLPYGPRIRVAVPRSDAQAVLVALPATAEARGEASATGPSPLPFQPRVETVTSAATAAPGSAVSDHVVVSVDQGDGLLPSWGVRAAEEGFVPVDAVIESTLLGPFSSPIEQSSEAPDGAPVVCTVETVVSGAGEYDTPACVLPRAGYYVWAETIDPARTPGDQGGERLRPWRSPFGLATEVTHAEEPAAPAAQPAPRAPELAATGSDASPAFALAAAMSVLGGVAALVVSHRKRRCAHPRHRSTFAAIHEARQL